MKNNKNRARTDAEKMARREHILTAARVLIAETGFDNVTMKALAQQAGLAKATLYLYVKTKEEVFALLLAEDFANFTSAILPALADDDALVLQMVFHAEKHVLFLPFLARLTTIIEANLSQQALITFKRLAWKQVERIATELMKTRHIEYEEAVELTFAIITALQGAAQYCVRPMNDITALPDDVRQLYENATFEAVFSRIIRLILKGAKN